MLLILRQCPKLSWRTKDRIADIWAEILLRPLEYEAEMFNHSSQMSSINTVLNNAVFLLYCISHKIMDFLELTIRPCSHLHTLPQFIDIFEVASGTYCNMMI
jgi:hypothetical protein